MSVVALLVVVGLLIALIAALRHTDQRPARMACVVSLAMLAVAVAGLSVQAVTRTGLGSHQVRWLFALVGDRSRQHPLGRRRVGGPTLAASPCVGRWLDIGLGVVLAALTIANLPFYAHDLGSDRGPRRAGDARAHVR